jgi:glutamine synthetase
MLAPQYFRLVPSDRDGGRITLERLGDLAGLGAIDTVVAGFTDHYGRLVGKRFDVGYFVDTVAPDGAHGCDYLLTVDMEMEPVAGYEHASWAQGYGDMHLVPDLTTLRVADWLLHTAIVLCDVVDPRAHELVAVAPRTILRAQLSRLGDLGLVAMAGTELEHYVYRTSYAEAARTGHRDLERAGWYGEDYQLLQGARTEDFHGAVRRHLARSGIPVESSKGETGLGQHELNVRYADALEMADRHVLFKQCLKETADRQGLSVTFMAKPFTGEAGSSCHVHLSMWRDGENAFAGDTDLGLGEDGPRGSATLLGFLGGCIAMLPDLMLLLAPTVNSYKRYVDASWAPTRLAWGYDNRTTALRVVGSGDSLRVECRLPGADCNPYLALAAIVGAGAEGIEQQIEPPPAFTGDAYRAALPRLPGSLRESTERFAGSEPARALFGDVAVDHYTHAADTEQAAFDAAVTDWERHRYFERI